MGSWFDRVGDCMGSFRFRLKVIGTVLGCLMWAGLVGIWLLARYRSERLQSSTASAQQVYGDLVHKRKISEGPQVLEALSEAEIRYGPITGASVARSYADGFGAIVTVEMNVERQKCKTLEIWQFSQKGHFLEHVSSRQPLRYR
jgi:hypothetical protein